VAALREDLGCQFPITNFHNNKCYVHWMHKQCICLPRVTCPRTQPVTAILVSIADLFMLLRHKPRIV
jgi:hypothetical protein